MTKVVWGNPTERTYETGIDRGMLYPVSGPGVAWNGLKTVTENPTGGAPVAYYIDGIKARQRSSVEDFGFTIEAITYPPEFAQCDGTQWNGKGLGFGLQPRQKFNLSYRTKIGTGVDSEAGYKIHLVYNAMAAPTTRAQSTLKETTDPVAFSWTVSTVPVRIPGYAPTSHLIIDSRKISPQLLTVLEGYLYGTDTSDPIFPKAIQLATLFSTWTDFAPFTFKGILPGAPTNIINAATNGRFETTDITSNLRFNFALDPNMVGTNSLTANSAALHTITKNVAITGHPQGITTAAKSVMVAGHVATPYLLSAYNPDNQGGVGSLSRYIGAWFYASAAGYSASFFHEGAANKVSLPAGVWTWLGSKTKVAADVYSQTLITKDSGNVTNDADFAMVTGITVDQFIPPVDAVWGSRPPGDDKSYAWVGSANASASVQKAPQPYGTIGSNTFAIWSSQWAQSPTRSARLTPYITDVTKSSSAIVAAMAANYQAGYTLQPGKTYVVTATRYIPAPLQGTLDNTYAGRILMTQTGPAGVPTLVSSTQQAPNTAGVYTITQAFTVDPQATAAVIRLGHGGGFGAGDVWWDDLLITDTSDYNGPVFYGDTAPFVYRNQDVFPGWMGAAGNSMSIMPYHSALPSVGVSEGDAYINDGSLWVRQGGNWKVKTAVTI